MCPICRQRKPMSPSRAEALPEHLKTSRIDRWCFTCYQKHHRPQAPEREQAVPFTPRGNLGKYTAIRRNEIEFTIFSPENHVPFRCLSRQRPVIDKIKSLPVGALVKVFGDFRPEGNGQGGVRLVMHCTKVVHLARNS